MTAPLRKLIGGGAERKSRLHTRRGLVAPVRELLHVPGLLVSRRGPMSNEPWMARGAVARLDQLLKPDMRLLELGSGTSTSWYAARVAEVVSIEPDSAWAKKTRIALADAPHAEVRLGTIADLAPKLLRDPRFDVVVVDHKHEPGMSRPDALSALSDSVQIAVLDDSDRPSYADVEQMMSKEWIAERYVSFRSTPLAPTETTIFLRK